MTVVHRWLAEPLPREVAAAVERLAAAPGVEHVAVMPDVHLAEHVCVGTVLGTVDRLYPQAVGGDIGCGMAAVRVDAPADLGLDESAAQELLRVLHREVPPLRRESPVANALGALSDDALGRRLRRDAAIEFGTLGRGNHFVELQQDEHGALWLAVHSGSRAVGPAVRDHHLARGEAVGKGLVALAADGAGHDYRHDVEVAMAFADASRRELARGAERALRAVFGCGLDWSTWFVTVHNSVRQEVHDGRSLLVHRKGAAPAGVGEPGIVPGSMGTRTFHVAGRGVAAALASCAHGAGRRLPRGVAARRISPRELCAQMQAVFFEAHLAARLCDEAPTAYKDIGAVMRAQRELVRVVRTLRPVLAYKAV